MAFLIFPNKNLQKPDGVLRVDYSKELSRGLVYLGYFNEAAGFTRDATRKQDLGVLSGAATHTITNRGRALHFTNGADSLAITTTRELPTGASAPFTIGVLVRMTSAPSLASIFGIGVDPAGSPSAGARRGMLAFGGGSNDHIYFWGNSADLSSGVSWDTTGAWQYVFITYDGTTITFYRGGASIGTPGVPGASLTTADAQIWSGSHHSSGANTFTGDISKQEIYNRCLSAAEIRDLTTYPWSQIERPSTKIWVPPSAGGTTYTYSGSGGIVFAGTAPLVRIRNYPASGGIVFSGTAPLAHTKIYTPSGGIVFAGTAPLAHTKVYTPSGGIVFAGTAAASLTSGGTTYTYAGSGGIVFAGHAPLVRIRAYLPSGGLTFAGTAPLVRIRAYLPSGGLVFAGTAAASITRAGQYTYVGSGGLSFAGTAILARTKVYTPTGGLTFAGSAGEYVPINRTVTPTGGANWYKSGTQQKRKARVIKYSDLESRDELERELRKLVKPELTTTQADNENLSGSQDDGANLQRIDAAAQRIESDIKRIAAQTALATEIAAKQQALIEINNMIILLAA